MVRFYFNKGLAPSSQRTYKSAQERYLKFCFEHNYTPIPITQTLLCSYVAYLGHSGLKHTTIKVYLSAVRQLQISQGLKDPFAGEAMPQLDQVMRGIKRVEAEKGVTKRERLPISPNILTQLKQAWSPSGHTHNTKMNWAASTLCFFAFLRAGEMTIPDGQQFDESAHLSVKDIAVDDVENPSMMQVRVKQSKTDPFRRGVNLYVGRTGADLCPVSAMLDYLNVRGMSAGPLFKFEDGRPLTRQRFVDEVRKGLKLAGINQDKYSGHSFRSGAATTAAARGVEDSIIKTLGRWESLAYLRYVKISRSELAGISSVLASP